MGIGLYSTLVGEIQQEFQRSLSKKGAIESNFHHMKFTSSRKESRKCPTTRRTVGKPCKHLYIINVEHVEPMAFINPCMYAMCMPNSLNEWFTACTQTIAMEREEKKNVTNKCAIERFKIVSLFASHTTIENATFLFDNKLPETALPEAHRQNAEPDAQIRPLYWHNRGTVAKSR